MRLHIMTLSTFAALVGSAPNAFAESIELSPMKVSKPAPKPTTGTSTSTSGSTSTSTSSSSSSSSSSSTSTSTSGTSTVSTARPSTGGDVTVDSGASSLVGVDVYEGQGVVNWSEVAASGRSFAYVQATQGITITDSEFATSWKSQSLIAMGAYHFFYSDDSGAAQAAHFLSVVGTMKIGTNMPPMVDVEEASINTTSAVAIAQLQAFLTAVEASTGMLPVIYTNIDTWTNKLGNPTQFAAYPLYIADYSGEPSLPPPWSNWLFWQYNSNNSTCPAKGITGGCDVDMFNGTAAQFQIYLKSGGFDY